MFNHAYVHTYVCSHLIPAVMLSIGSLQLEDYKHRCTDLEAELAVVEMANESNLQQVRKAYACMCMYVCTYMRHIVFHMAITLNNDVYSETSS